MIRLALVLAAVALAAPFVLRSPDLWWSRDQQGMQLLEAGRELEAAERFRDPAWRGVALYREGEFEDAAVAFSSVATPVGAYNRGNALLMHGDYDGAIEQYDLALEGRPGWQAAEDNRELAKLRRIVRKGGEGTGGMLGADEIVFSDQKGEAGESVEVTGEVPSDDASFRALWLRNVQTRPGDFLRVKFGQQLAQQQNQASPSGQNQASPSGQDPASPAGQNEASP